jgi:hypothetical protein
MTIDSNKKQPSFLTKHRKLSQNIDALNYTNQGIFDDF